MNDDDELGPPPSPPSLQRGFAQYSAMTANNIEDERIRIEEANRNARNIDNMQSDRRDLLSGRNINNVMSDFERRRRRVGVDVGGKKSRRRRRRRGSKRSRRYRRTRRR